MQLKKTPIICIALLLSGCGLLGPSYTRPKVETPTGWVSKDSLAKMDDKVNLPDLAWWKSFNDPVLTGLIDAALENNTSIQSAIGSITAAKGYLQQIQMGWVPNIGGSFAYVSPQNMVLGGGNSALSGSSSVAAAGSSFSAVEGYNAGFLPSYTLNIFQQIKSQENAKALLLTQQFAKDAMRLTIIGQVAAGYFSLLGNTYQLKLQQQLTADADKQLELGQAQYKAGYISLLTLQNYIQQYNNAKARVPIVQNNIVASQNALRVLITRSPGPINNSKDFMSIKVDGVIPANLPSKVLENRPDIRQAEAQLMADNANIGVAKANFFPSISLTGSELGFASSSLTSLFGTGTAYWQNAAAATMPLLNLSYLGTIKQNKGTYYKDFYAYVNTVQSAFQQVDNGLSGHQKLTESYNTQKEAFNSAKKQYGLGFARYQAGADSYVQAITYKVVMDNAALTLSSSKLQQLQSIVTLYQALAGGYNVDNTETPRKFGDGRDV